MAKDEATPTASTCSFRKDDLVTILVGPDEEAFAVHESCITRTSDFFKAAMKEEWTERQMRAIKLPEETCLDTFNRYLNFAYLKKFDIEEIKTMLSEYPSRAGSPYLGLVKVYVLGERLLDRSVQHAVIREILRLTKIKNEDGRCTCPGTLAIQIAYEGTTHESPIRRLIVDLLRDACQWRVPL